MHFEQDETIRKKAKMATLQLELQSENVVYSVHSFIFVIFLIELILNDSIQ